MPFVLFFLIPLFLVVGCATTTKDLMPSARLLLPPSLNLNESTLPKPASTESIDQHIRQVVDERGDQVDRWWGQYKRAQIWKEEKPQVACENFYALWQTPLFPIRDVAYIHALETCDMGHPIHLTVGNEGTPDLEVQWLKNTYLDIKIQLAEKSDDHEKMRELYIKKSKLNLPREVKLEFTRKALKLAGDDEVLKKSYMQRLYKLSPKLNPKPRRADYKKIAYDYRRARDFKSAIKYYQKVASNRKLPFRQRISALKGIRTSYKLSRDKENYRKATETLANKVARYYRRARKNRYNKKLYVDTHTTLARTLWTLGKVKVAKAVLRKIPRVVKKYSMAEVYWLRGRMMEEKQEFSAAIWWFDKALAEKNKSKDFEEKLRWYKAWNLKKINKLELATQELQKLKDLTEDPYTKARYQFWLAKSLRDSKSEEEAKAEFQELMTEDPIGFYGLMAHRETKQPLALKSIPQPIPLGKQVPPELVDYLDPLYISWLTAVGESDIAKLYLNQVAKAYRKQRSHNEDGWLYLFSHYARAGHYLSLFTQIGMMNPEERRSLLDSHPEILFPRPFLNFVNAASNRFGVSTEFIFSIMRQESAFNTRARSHADAFGLMQLIPKNAAKAAADLNVVFTDSDMLFEPEFNIQAGSAYIRQLWEQYQGRFILTAASYNASNQAIRGWMRTRYRGNVLEFIEDIPYEETRGYVKLVMRNFLFYSMLNAGGTELVFPEWVLNLEDPASTKQIKAENELNPQSPGSN